MSTYTGFFLKVNLSSGAVSRDRVSVDLQKKFIGGRGFGISYLFGETRPGIRTPC